MCDVTGLGEGEGISVYDILAVIKGHAPEGHKVREEAVGGVRDPFKTPAKHGINIIILVSTRNMKHANMNQHETRQHETR